MNRKLKINYITKWISVILIVAIVCSFFTTACKESEETSRVRIMLDIEREKSDQLKIEKGIPVVERTLTNESSSR